jgi:hypothetical protein
MASKCITVLTLISASMWISELLDLSLQMHLHTRLSTASKCISELHHLRLQMHLQTHSLSVATYIYELHNLGLQGHHQTLSITATKFISELHHLGLPIDLQTGSITPFKCNSELKLISGCKCISKLTQLRRHSTSPSTPVHGVLVHLQLLTISVSTGSCDYAPVPSPARLAVCIYSERLREIIHAILWYSKSCDYNNGKSDKRNCFWLPNSKNHCSQNTALSLPHSCVELSCCSQSLRCSKLWLLYKSKVVISWMHLHNCKCFQEHLRMLLQSPSALCIAPVGPRSI